MPHIVRQHDEPPSSMDKILPNLFVGDIDDSLDSDQLRENKIQRMVRIDAHPNSVPKTRTKHKTKFLMVEMEDAIEVDLITPIAKVNSFIHEGRLNGEAVLVHCSAGKNRSVSLTAAYVCTITNHSLEDVFEAIKIVRNKAGPHSEYQEQLRAWEAKASKAAKSALEKEFGPFSSSDHHYIDHILNSHIEDDHVA